MGNRRSHAKGGSSPLWHWTRESAPGSTAQAPQHTLCWQTPTLILDPELLQAVVVIRIDMPSMSYWEEVQTIFTPQPTPPSPGFCLCLQFISAFLYSVLFWFSLWTSYNISLGPSCEYNKIFNVHVHFESVCKSWVYLFLEIIFQKWSGLSNSLSPRRESCSQPKFCLFIDYVVFLSRCLSSSSLSLKICVIIDEWSLFWHGELKNRVDSLQLKPNF